MYVMAHRMAMRNVLLSLATAPPAAIHERQDLNGGTTWHEATAQRLGRECRLAAIVGDIATELDAERLRESGLRAHQIITGGACHLDARLVTDALGTCDVLPADVLFIENVGNLVCPAAFDLGEHRRVVVASTPEGEDKPVKYPVAFRSADCVVLNKIDLVEATDFSPADFSRFVRDLGLDVPLLQLSCKTGEGLDAWIGWLRAEREAVRRAEAPAKE